MAETHPRNPLITLPFLLWIPYVRYQQAVYTAQGCLKFILFDVSGVNTRKMIQFYILLVNIYVHILFTHTHGH